MPIIAITTKSSTNVNAFRLTLRVLIMASLSRYRLPTQSEGGRLPPRTKNVEDSRSDAGKMLERLKTAQRQGSCPDNLANPESKTEESDRCNLGFGATSPTFACGRL